MLGVNPGDLVAHSCSKGVSTMISAVFTVSRPIKLICIRCGWSMGRFKEIYLKDESSEDQYVGHCDSSLDQK